MASIKKRGDGYRAQVRRKGFSPESATFPVRAQAVEWAKIREAELIGTRHGLMPTRTVRQALERYRQFVCPKHKGARWEQVRIDKFLGAPTKRAPDVQRKPSIPFIDRDLDAVTSDDIATWRDVGLQTLAPGSVRREYGVLRAVFALCVGEWTWLRASPFERVTPPADGDARTRRVSDAEAKKICAALGYRHGRRPESSSEYTAVAFLLALETMMRQGEILSLTREQINAPGAFLHLPKNKTKGSTARDVPLSPAALALLKLLPRTGQLFPITSGTCDTLFRRARDAVKVKALRFHDSRREATTRLSKKWDVLTLAKAGGWKDVNLLLRVYYAPSASDAAKQLR